MSKYVAVICEGKTEEIFCNKLLAPYFLAKNIYLIASQITKPGEKGGDVKFDKMMNDIKNYIWNPNISCITTFFDFYGLSGPWPEYESAKAEHSHTNKSNKLTTSVKAEVETIYNTNNRFLPFFAMHETEAYYFSCPASMAHVLGVREAHVQKILTECREPEAINHQPHTSPSHRIASLLGIPKFIKKTTDGIAIAESAGLQKMIDACPLFAQWLIDIEEHCS